MSAIATSHGYAYIMHLVCCGQQHNTVGLWSTNSPIKEEVSRARDDKGRELLPQIRKDTPYTMLKARRGMFGS